MSYDTEAIAKSLREARTAKGLSQRDLSTLAGVPQAQISRIEAGTVDPRTTSLIALAHALDMELALVPRKAVPAVKSIARRSIGHGFVPNSSALKEFSRITETLRSLQVQMPALDGLTQLQRSVADLERFKMATIEPETFRNIRKTMERIQEPTRSLQALTQSQEAIKALRNRLAHDLPSLPQSEDRPRPAYSLDEDDNA